MNICWTYLGRSKRVSVANYVYTFHASLRASEFIRKMWDDEVVESLIETSPWQKRGAWYAQSGRVNAMCWGTLWGGYSMEGQWAAAAVLQNDHLRPTLLSWKQLQRRPNVAEKYCQVMKAIKPRVTSGSWFRKNWWWAKLVSTSFCCSERRQKGYQSENSFIIQQPDTVE